MNTLQPQITEEDHARQNAQGWAQSIAEMVAALECDYHRLKELNDEFEDVACGDYNSTAAREWVEANGQELKDINSTATLDGEIFEDDETARERIQESPLSIEVRSGWTSPGEPMQAEEFCILLTTGGPALRIRGELNEHKEPDRAWLEYQDWGTPWTEYHGEGCEHSTLLTFCQQFYFGE